MQFAAYGKFVLVILSSGIWLVVFCVAFGHRGSGSKPKQVFHKEFDLSLDAQVHCYGHLYALNNKKGKTKSTAVNTLRL